MNQNRNKKGLDKIALVILGGVLLIAGVIVLVRYMMQDECPDNVEIQYDGVLIVGEEIRFYCLVGEDFHWDFGDNSEHVLAPGPKHIFTTPGTFHVTLTVNTQCTVDKTIIIEPAPNESPKVLDLKTPSIEGPKNGDKVYVGKPVQFKGYCDGATKWEWTFEDVMQIITEQNPTYTFKSPGKKTVMLTVNGQSESARLELNVERSPDAPKPPPPAPDINATILKYLKEIAAGNNANYKRLLDLCSSPSIPVQQANGSTLILDTYLSRLPLNGSVEGSSVKVTTENNYITKITIK